MSDIEMWIEKDNVRVWLSKHMGGGNDVINQNLTYDQSGADTYNIQSGQIQSG
jgi:hypothetical protein